MAIPDFHLLALGAALALLGATRAHELSLSRRNERAMLGRGGYEAPGSRLPLFVALHAAMPIALLVEVVALGARSGPLWPLWLALWLGAEWLRAASMRALGDRWSARIYVVPGEPPVRRGPYRFFAHPSYLAVTLELAALPLLFGAWRTALGAGVVNALLLALRIRSESRALREAARAPFDPSR
ncbi:MAG TPA: isoprenylcysteine carboxylmethyltransferase family protein [Candidatus Eisenbacteria bacterium]|nr:isoprenylcysteine carboxylmethyltransferase family protein [Candidatus Eisenbacteria bacterium]